MGLFFVLLNLSCLSPWGTSVLINDNSSRHDGRKQILLSKGSIVITYLYFPITVQHHKATHQGEPINLIFNRIVTLREESAITNETALPYSTGDGDRTFMLAISVLPFNITG